MIAHSHSSSSDAKQHWSARFAVHLMQLRPDLTLRNAVARGAIAYPMASTLTPEDAAQVDADAVLASPMPPLFRQELRHAIALDHAYPI